MNEYTGKICPYCKTSFAEGDSIVICSECEMPHHMECWIENQGCTTFGCNGTIDNPDGQSQEQHAQNQRANNSDFDTPHYCVYCGAKTVAGDQFCRSCGRRFPAQGSEPSAAYGTQQQDSNGYLSAYTSASGTSLGDEDRYIVQNIPYYKYKFNEMRSQHKDISWNWAAFFIAPYWFLYRKLYGIGIGVLAGSFVLSLLGVVGNTFALAGYIVLGIYANNIYMKHIQKLIAMEQTVREPFRSQHIHTVGGVNMPAAVLTAVGYFILRLIIAL